MPGASYERYGLTSNPFRDLASENIEDVAIYHVNQEVDDTLQTIRDEVYDKENRAVVGIIGPHGAGKTERLLVTAAEARERGAFCVYFDVPAKTAWVLRGVAAQFLKEAKARGRVKLFSQPPWMRAMTTLSKVKEEKYDAKNAGKVLGQALNESAPSLLLLNDLNNLIESREVNAFAAVIQEITDSIKPGVLVMFTCYASYIAWLTVNHPALASRINRTFTLAGLSDGEASVLLAKKLLVKRLVEDLDPIYPFDKEAVHALTQASGANPRRLLELADLSIEYGIAHRAYRVDLDVVQAIIAQRAANQAATSAARMPPTKNPAAKPSASASPTDTSDETMTSRDPDKWREGPAPATLRQG